MGKLQTIRQQLDLENASDDAKSMTRELAAMEGSVSSTDGAKLEEIRHTIEKRIARKTAGNQVRLEDEDISAIGAEVGKQVAGNVTIPKAQPVRLERTEKLLEAVETATAASNPRPLLNAIIAKLQDEDNPANVKLQQDGPLTVQVIDKDGKIVDFKTLGEPALVGGVSVNPKVFNDGTDNQRARVNSNRDQYVALIDDDGNKATITGGKLETTATLSTGDIEIGAVELKDGDSDTRGDIEADGAKNALYVQSNSLATETTLGTLATESTLGTLATEATLGTLATETTLNTLATEATLASIDTALTTPTTVTAAQDATITSTPAAFASVAGTKFIFQADPSNGANVSIGDSANQYLVLEPGDSITIEIDDNTQVWRKAASGTQTVNIISTS